MYSGDAESFGLSVVARIRNASFRAPEYERRFRVVDTSNGFWISCGKATSSTAFNITSGKLRLRSAFKKLLETRLLQIENNA